MPAMLTRTRAAMLAFALAAIPLAHAHTVAVIYDGCNLPDLPEYLWILWGCWLK
jgi:hypothetical protein